jgi:hypothetical protein
MKKGKREGEREGGRGEPNNSAVQAAFNPSR